MHTQMFRKGIDEVLMMSKLWVHRVLPKYGPDAPRTSRAHKPNKVRTLASDLI